LVIRTILLRSMRGAVDIHFCWSGALVPVRLCYFSLRRLCPCRSLCFEPGDFGMKVLGFLMLLAGWFLVLAAIVLFASPPLRAAFVLAGIAVEALGLILAFRSHLIPREEKR
jgi:hypothetical protein